MQRLPGYTNQSLRRFMLESSQCLLQVVSASVVYWSETKHLTTDFRVRFAREHCNARYAASNFVYLADKTHSKLKSR